MKFVNTYFEPIETTALHSVVNEYDSSAFAADLATLPKDLSQVDGRWSVTSAITVGGLAYLGAAIARLLAAGLGKERPIRVLDIGGAFGTHYSNARRLLGPDIRYDWTVVELPGRVAAARQHFRTPGLAFADDLDLALCPGYDLIICSSVLSYLPDPYGLILRIGAAAPKYLIIDRQHCVVADQDCLARQTVIYEEVTISHPIRFLSLAQLEIALARHFTIAVDWRALFEGGKVGEQIWFCVGMLAEPLR